MFKKIILIVVILCSMKMFTLVFIPDMLIEVIEMAGVSIMLLFLVLYFIYGERHEGKMRFTFPVVLILVSVALSMLGAFVFQEQSFAITAMAQRVIYFYLIYFLLHYLKISNAYITKTIAVFGVVYMVLYFTQYMVYPTALIKSKMFIDRGTLRIFMPGAGFIVIAYFIWLYSFFKTYKLKYGLLLLGSLGIFVLLGTRQVIASILLLTIVFVLQSKVVKSKFLLFALIGIAIIPVYFLFQDIITAMFDVTMSQSRTAESGIRLRAATYFLTDFYNNKWAYFIGNGYAGSSGYGLRMDRITVLYSYYQSDIGLIGEYTKYGLLFVIAVFIILYRALTTKLPEDLMFIKFNFLGLIMTLVTGAGAFGSTSNNILINCMLLYMIDNYLNEKNSLTSMNTLSQ